MSRFIAGPVLGVVFLLLAVACAAQPAIQPEVENPETVSEEIQSEEPETAGKPLVTVSLSPT